MRDAGRSDAAALLVELGLTPKLTIYLAGAPGAGKTHRLITDAAGEARAGRRVAIGWIETKNRPQLEELAATLPRIPPRRFADGARIVEDFDLEAALASDYETILLDELAHANPAGAPHAKRWQDALALREAGKSVLGAFNVMHLDTVAPVAERIIGYPIREVVPMAFVRKADRVIALDVAPSVLESRLRTGRIVREEDVERAAAGLFQPKNLSMMRELLLRVVDDLTIPIVAPSKVSIALAVVAGTADPEAFVRRAAAFADALDLALETTGVDGYDAASARRGDAARRRRRRRAAGGPRARRDERGSRVARHRAARTARRPHPGRTVRSRAARRRSGARRADLRTRQRAASVRLRAGRPAAHRLRQADDLSRLGGGKRQDLRDARPRASTDRRRSRRRRLAGRNARPPRNDRASWPGSNRSRGLPNGEMDLDDVAGSPSQGRAHRRARAHQRRGRRAREALRRRDRGAAQRDRRAHHAQRPALRRRRATRSIG